jgi:hypothetical protein
MILGKGGQLTWAKKGFFYSDVLPSREVARFSAY